MGYLLAVDPGYRQTGLALFEGKTLNEGALLEIGNTDTDLAMHWKDQWQMIEWWLKCATSAFPLSPISVVTEIMQIDGRTGKAQADALLKLSGTAAISVSLASDSGSVAGYTPSEWNKNRPKGPNQGRIIRSLDKKEKERMLKRSVKRDDCGGGRPLFPSLRPAITCPDALYERAIDGRLGMAEHVIDAVGIGLYHLGRL